MDDLFEITVQEKNYNNNEENDLKEEVLTVKAIENNLQLRFLSGEENYIDNGKLFIERGDVENNPNTIIPVSVGNI